MIEPSGEFAQQLEIPDRCKRCITLARLAFRHEDIGRKISEVSEARMSGDLERRWVAEAASVGGMTDEEAAAFVASQEPLLTAEFISRLEELDGRREAQLQIARGVIEHCAGGMLTLTTETSEEQVTVEACNSRSSEALQGVPGAHVVRMIRQPIAAKVVD